MDARIDPTVHLTAELRNRASASGALFVIMSKRYDLQSGHTLIAVRSL